MRYAKRPRYVKEFVLIDGMGRAGKFMLGKIVAAFERMEFLQEAVLIDHLLHLARFNKIDEETCEVLLQTHLDLLAYYMMIGRNLNSRASDASAITNAPEPDQFLLRARTKEEGPLTQRILSEGRLPLFLSHDALCSARIFFKIFPEAKMIQMIRHPASVIRSWHRRQWGQRIGMDPRAFDINFTKGGQPIPWFAVDWETDYYALPELDRIVYAVHSILQKARTEYDACDERVKARVAFVTYEEMLQRPHEAITRIAGFLGRQPTDKLQAILEREQLPQPATEADNPPPIQELSRALSPWGQDLFRRTVEEFEQYWKPLVEERCSPI